MEISIKKFSVIHYSQGDIKNINGPVAIRTRVNGYLRKKSYIEAH